MQKQLLHLLRSMKNLFFVFLVSVIVNLLSGHLVFANTPEVKKIAIGSSLRFRLDYKTAPQVFDRNLIKAKVESGHLVLTGLKVGETLVRVNDQVLNIHITPPLYSNYEKQYQQACAGTLGIKCNLVAGLLTVEGTFYRFKDYVQLRSRLLEVDKDLQFQMAILDKYQFFKELEKYLNRELKQNGLLPQNITPKPFAIVTLNKNNSFKDRYLKIYQSHGILLKFDETALTLKETLNVRITIAEVRRSETLKYGISWPDAFKATLLPNGILENDISNFSLNTLSAQGHAKILAEPTIICRSGEEAEFLAGGEIPIKIINYKYQQIEWKKYGIQLKVKPQTDQSGRIRLSVITEVSTMDPSRKAEDLPGFLTNKVTSHFDLNSSQTIAISGLIKNEESNNHSGIPGIKNLPIIGSLFSSKEFLNNQTELVVFVTPTFMDIL